MRGDPLAPKQPILGCIKIDEVFRHLRTVSQHIEGGMNVLAAKSGNLQKPEILILVSALAPTGKYSKKCVLRFV